VADSPEHPQSAAAALEALGARELDPHLAPFLETWLDTFIFQGRLEARLRELPILRIMWRYGQAFEWGNHYRLARQAGITKEEILAIRTAAPGRDLNGPVALVVKAADEVVDVGYLHEDTMAAVRDLFPERSLLDEFLYLLGGYRMFAMVSASKREPRTSSYPAWPPDGVGPGDTATTLGRQ
jgi:alkylhydroperoxidase/carboxymuconolactone decarboxylase family protein YurZ